MDQPKVIAARGDGVYLLHLGGNQGQIADVGRGVLISVKDLAGIISRGCWEPVHDLDVAARKVLSLVDRCVHL